MVSLNAFAADCDHDFNLDEDIKTAVTCNTCGEVVYESDSRWTEGSYEGFIDGTVATFKGYSEGNTDEIVAYYVVKTNDGELCKLSFDWTINQGYTAYGGFNLFMYHNETEVITHAFTSEANPYRNIISEEYTYTADGKYQVFKFVFEKTNKGTWADGGRTAYLDNINHAREQVEEHTVTVLPTSGGTVTADKNTATAGETVTLTVTPDEGYMFDSLDVFYMDDATSNWVYIELAEIENGYTFVMPDVDVEVDAKWECYHTGDITYLYCDENSANWQTGTKEAGNYESVTSSDAAWGTSGTDTWYVASGEITISSRITVQGNVHLILADDATLTASAGIGVNEGNSLTIYGQENGTGTLVATTTTNFDAAIGGTGGASGRITINGGTVNVTGGVGGAGIGGGYNVSSSDGYGSYGTVTINGGNVQATGGDEGAGIGGGAAGSGTVTINGGIVEAQGGMRAAGIGGGNMGKGNVTISGGTVNATGNVGGAGIGGGAAGSGTVTINGGTTIAQGKAFDAVPTITGTFVAAVWYGDSEELANAAGAQNISDLAANYNKNYVKIAEAPTEYAITISTPANGGAVTANKTTAPENDTVTLTVNPAEGYVLESLTVTGASGAVETTAGEDNTYTFTMPASDVTVTAAFRSVTFYTIWVGGTQVTSDNASDVLGDGKVSYDPATYTLTLNNAIITAADMYAGNLPIHAGIYVGNSGGIDSLNIKLIGTNFIIGGRVTGDVAEAAGIYSEVNLTISDGTLHVSGANATVGSHGINAQGQSITITDATVVAKGSDEHDSSWGISGDAVIISGNSHVIADGSFYSGNCTVTDGTVYYTCTSAGGTFTKNGDLTSADSYREIITAAHLGDYTQNGDTHSLACPAGCAMHRTVVNGEACSGTYTNGFRACCGGYEPATDLDNDGYYEIGNAGQLYWFAELVNSGTVDANAILINDIVINENVLDENGSLNEGEYRSWTPIGYYNSNSDYNMYQGTFDGNNKVVRGLYINDTSKSNVGLFGYVYKGKIQNTGVEDSYIYADSNVGGVVGYISNEGSIIDNCYNKGYVGGVSFVGGVCGFGYLSTITACFNAGNVVCSNNYIGGIAGDIVDATITNSYNTGSVDGDTWVGGVVGSNGGTINNCWNAGLVNGENIVGGVVGSNADTVSNCYNAASVSGSYNVGNVCGGSSGSFENVYYLATEETDSIDGTTFKTAEQFASGEVAYLLQQGNTEQVWGQDSNQAGAMPMFDLTGLYKVVTVGETGNYSVANVGDTNGDGTVDVIDYQALVNEILSDSNEQIETASYDDIVRYDLDGDGYLDVIDASLMHLFINGFTTVDVYAVGDYDLNGIAFEEADIKAIKHAIENPEKLATYKKYASDINGDGKVDAEDTTLLADIYGEITGTECADNVNVYYRWGNKYSTCTATAMCTLCGKKVATETVNSVNNGDGSYTATFTNTLLGTKTYKKTTT